MHLRPAAGLRATQPQHTRALAIHRTDKQALQREVLASKRLDVRHLTAPFESAFSRKITSARDSPLMACRGA